MPDLQKTAWRRLYVFVAVALAVFLATLSAIGMMCHGFATGSGKSVQPVTVQQLSIPPEIKSELAAAQRQGQEAYQTVQAAVDQYQQIDVEIQDLLNAHFDDLLHTAVTMAKQPDVAPQTVAAPLPAPAEATVTMPPDQLNAEALPPTPAEQHAEINPRYQDLEDQIVQLRRQRTVLSETLLPNHPRIQKLDMSLSDLEDRLKSVRKEAPSPITGDLNLLQPERIAVQPASAKPAAPQPNVIASLLPRWQKAADDYHELTDRLLKEKNECYTALNHESAAWQRKAQIPADYLATVMVEQTTVQSQGADPRLAMLWSASVAVAVAGLVAQRAEVSEAMFQTAAQVRQRLSLTVLGFLPRKLNYTTREIVCREPRWIRRTLLAAELYLAALVVMLLVLSLLDRQFLGHLMANPLAACSQKFWS